MEYLISYTAPIAELSDLQVVEFEGSRWIRGCKVDETRDIFIDYRTKDAHAHLEFANCGEDEASILEFSAKWGVVPMPILLPRWLDPDDSLRGFEFEINQWLQLQRHMRSMIEFHSSRTSSLSDQQESFERARSLDLPRGMGVDIKLNDKMEPRLVPQSMWIALCLMVFLDRGGDKRILHCANLTCGVFFSTHRANKKFCSQRCAQIATNRRAWKKHGPKWRANARTKKAKNQR